MVFVPKTLPMLRPKKLGKLKLFFETYIISFCVCNLLMLGPLTLIRVDHNQICYGKWPQAVESCL